MIEQVMVLLMFDPGDWWGPKLDGDCYIIITLGLPPIATKNGGRNCPFLLPCSKGYHLEAILNFPTWVPHFLQSLVLIDCTLLQAFSQCFSERHAAHGDQ